MFPVDEFSSAESPFDSHFRVTLHLSPPPPLCNPTKLITTDILAKICCYVLVYAPVLLSKYEID